MTNNYKFGKLLFIMIVLQILNKVQTQHPNDLNFKQLYRYTDEPEINVLEPGYNKYSLMELEIPISFYSKTYHRIYINTNGILTFDKEFPGSQVVLNPQNWLRIPLIAPFFANVDTSDSGNTTIISLFKSQNHEKLHKANSLVRKKYSNNFEATILYVATWENVGYYHAKTDKFNTFQAIIICNSDQSYVQFIYPEEGINWFYIFFRVIPAQAGFVSDDGRYFMINGSGTENVANLSKMSNIGINGVFLYRIGLLDFDSNISDEVNNEIISENLSPMSCAKAGRATCHSSASCNDKTKGFYCKCFKGFYGNGLSCISNTRTISISGSLSGQINNRTIDSDAEVVSIISMEKGVSETAIRPINDILEGQLKLAVPVFSSFGWLFAKPLSPKFMNGYQWTGGKFVHSSELTFESGEILHINQTFEVNDRQQKVKIDVNGFVPMIEYDEEIEIPGYTKELKFASPNTISSTVEHYVEIPSKNKNIKFQLSQNISFESCNSCYSNEIDVTEINSLEKISRTSLKLIPVPYSLRSTKMITNIGDDDILKPCDLGNCWKFSSCVPDQESYKCVCPAGLEEIVTEDGVECVDIDECQNELSPCRDDGYCVNVFGGYTCNCNNEDEYDCVRKIEVDEQRQDCNDNPKLCSDHASCIRSKTDRALFECVCNPGFYSSDNNRNVCEEETCKQNLSLCHPNANCHSINGTNTCVCKHGYHGNGTTCIKTKFIFSHQYNYYIKRLSFDGKLTVVVEKLYPTHIAIDCIEGRVYYYKKDKIFSANYDGTDSRLFITEDKDISNSEGFAIDSISRLIYYLPSHERAIKVESLNNPKMRTILVADESLGWFSDIAVDPIRGKLYWILMMNPKHPSQSKIEMSELDGTDREILLTLPFTALKLAVLPNSGDLCFYDGGFKLMCIDFHSKEVRNIALPPLRIDRITATNDSIYWYNDDRKTLEGIYFDGTCYLSKHCNPGQVVDKLIALEDYCPQGINPCQMNNGGCPLDTICLPNRSSSSGISCKQIKLT